ncbi:MAG: hypothetical protein ACF8SC_07685 [Phycisphaerales bacterium JB037]
MQRTTRTMMIAGGLLAAAGTLAWAALATPAAPAAEARQPAGPSIATIDSFRVMRALLQSPESVAAREEMARQYQNQLDLYEQQDIALAQEMNTLEADEARYQQIMQERQRLGQMYQQVAQQANFAIDQFSAQQAIEAFGKIRQTGVQVATEAGYSHLMSSAGRYDELVGSGTTAAMQEILSRPVLMAPSEDDITVRVMNTLGVTDPVPQQTPAGPVPLDPDAGLDHGDHDGHDHSEDDGHDHGG